MGETATAGGASKWGDVALVVNQALLQWYSTATQKPIAPGTPPSVMRGVFGTDFGGGPTILGQTAGTLGPLLLVGIVVVGVVLVARR
jgi:hypothetical protein